MKRMLASLSLVAVGATGLQAAHAPGLTRMESSKPWSISATLRGFYDDNYTTGNSAAGTDVDSFGVEVSPTFSYNLPLEQTYVGLSYTYSLQLYEARDSHMSDHEHEFFATVDHKFNERYSGSIVDSLVYSREPGVVDTGDTGQSTFLRTESNALRNRAQLQFRAELTETYGVEPFYRNTYVNYDDSGAGSRSSVLDRVEHLFGVNGRYRARPDLIALIGYNFGVTDYLGDEPLAPGSTVLSDDRNTINHYFYVGGEYAMTRQLKASLKVGGQYTDYTELDDNQWGPYVDGELDYTYLPGSSAAVGFKHSRNPTDIGFAGLLLDEGAVVKDQESTLLYVSVDHRVTPKLYAGAAGQFQHSVFHGGEADGDGDNLALIGLSARYLVTPNWSAEAGYNWTRLDSDQAFRSFSRNRVYLGVRASY